MSLDTKQTIVILHCFPVPYRNYLFEILQSQSTNLGLNFEVYFFAKYDSSRPNWKYSSDDLHFKHRFWKYIFKFRAVLHFNPLMIIKLFINPPSILIMGGVWSSVNTIILSLFYKSRIVAWDETNRYDFGSVNKNFIFFKRHLVKRLKYFAVPGLESRLYYEELLNKTEDSEQLVYFNLPNLIDESKFDKANLGNMEISNFKMELFGTIDKKIAFWPARLIKHKGILEFIKNVDKSIFGNWRIIILGSGPLEKEIRSLILEKDLGLFIDIHQPLSYEKVVKYFLAADFLLMPSIADSNPLSVIEGLHSGLPLFVSNRIGNYNEVLIENYNGFSCDPYSAISVRSNLTKCFSLTEAERIKMGMNSKILAEKNFGSLKITKDFILCLCKTFNLSINE